MIKIVCYILGLSVLTSCSTVNKPIENNMINSYELNKKNLPSEGIFSYEISLTQPQAMLGLEGTFIWEDGCLFFKDANDNQKHTPVFPIQFTSFNEKGDVITIANEPIRIGEEFSIGGFIVKDEGSHFITTGQGHCLTNIVAVLGLGVSALN